MFNFGILGNNARNLQYIKKFNPRKSVRLADNKQKTKNFLGERGIAFAETFAIIRTRQELRTFDFSTLMKAEFVVKPNHGSKGRGISIVKKLPSSPSQPLLFKIGEHTLTETELKHQLADILDGAYSMTYNDSILIEEKLLPGTEFKIFCTYGLADIRIIVCNLVPVAAMIRIPTEKSEGKANIGAGGLGCGIDMQTGKIFSSFVNGKLYKDHFPTESQPYQDKKLPFWDDLLFLSSKIQYFVNLGYLALDRVITPEGPKLLEINARAGLEIQKISDIRLKKVLNKIEDLHIQDPSQGVDIAKTLFGQTRTHERDTYKILYLSQRGKLKLQKEEHSEEVEVEVQVDLQKKKNYISPELYAQLSQTKHALHIELPENSILLRQLEFFPSETLQQTIILGRNVAENFLIKPQTKQQITINIVKPEMLIESEHIALHQLDENIERLHKRLNLTAKLRPQNYLNELDNFITRGGNYAPVFTYNFPDERKLQQRNDELKYLKESCTNGTLKSPLIKLFSEKLDELFIRLDLLRAYKHQDFAKIETGNRLLWGDFDEELIKISKEKSQETEHRELLGAKVSFKEVKQQIEKKLNTLEIFGVNIVENASNLSRISLTMGEETTINISQGVEFREQEIEAIFAHEIETHLVRYVNGVKSGRKIFASGTGKYLKDEEGLAIWNAKQKLPEGMESLGMWKKYYLLYEARNLHFKQLFDLVSIIYPQYSLEGKFKTCIRIRKGNIHNTTRNIGHCRGKNKIYLEGYEKMKEQKTLDKKLSLGKIKQEDIIYII